jgi:sulfite reductase (NADPH) flavoprotein alpha-component
MTSDVAKLPRREEDASRPLATFVAALQSSHHITVRGRGRTSIGDLFGLSKTGMTMRAILMWVHLVLGLTAAGILAIVAITGIYIAFQDPLTRWLNPVPAVSRSPGPVDVARIVARLERGLESRPITSVDVRDSQATVVRLQDRTAVFMHPDSGTILAIRPGRFASLENLTAVMRGLHTHLLLGARGRTIVTFATLEALLLALSGVCLWLRSARWQFRPWRGSLHRVSWDLHNASGIWFSIPMLGLVTTGLLLAIPGPVYRYAGAGPAPWPTAPGSTPAPAAAIAVSLARVLAAADSARPGEHTASVSVPQSRRAAFVVRKGDETVYVDQFSGSVIAVERDRTATAGDHAIEAVERIHTGAQFGPAGRLIMTLGSVMLAVMTVTGGVLGIRRLTILARNRPGARGA